MDDAREEEAAAAPEEDAPAARAARVRVVRGDDAVEVARGDVEIRAEEVAADPENTTIVIVHPDGHEEVLAQGAASSGWNTTAYENGWYEVEVRETREDGSTYSVASTRVLVENPRASAIAAVAAVATGAVATMGASVVMARGFDLASIMKQSVGDLFGSVAEERVRTKTAGMIPVAQRVRASLLLASVAILLLATARTWASVPSAAGFLAALPLTGAIVASVAAVEYGAEWALARASGAKSRFRLWAPGAASLLVSAFLFRSPFGYPGYVDEDEVGDDAAPAQKRLAGRRALATLGVAAALAGIFYALGLAWRWEVAETGVAVALMVGAAASLPVRPMPGRDVWEWNRWAAVGACLVFLGLHVMWQLALLPGAFVVLAGAFGVAAYAAALARLRTVRLPA